MASDARWALANWGKQISTAQVVATDQYNWNRVLLIPHVVRACMGFTPSGKLEST